MAEGADKRKYKRLDINMVVNLRRRVPGDDTRRRAREKIGNISSGGVFIEANPPFKVGTIVDFEFAVPGAPGTIKAKGVVRWSNSGFFSDRPVGMGVEFLEISTDSREKIQSFIQYQVLDEQVERVTRTPVHQELLRFRLRRAGESFTIDELSKLIRFSTKEIVEALQDFSTFRLVELKGDRIVFLHTENPEMARAILRWIESHDEEPGSP